VQTRPFKLTMILGSLLLSSGCASMNDYHYEKSQQMRARLQYHQCGNPGCSRYPKDYKKGWVDGFYEVSTGGSDCPPAVAPACYWHPDQILEDCDNRRLAYYSGWQDGAARASQFPDTHYLKIWESCDCPFPRCECAQCGGAVGSCGCTPAGCAPVVSEGGMVYDNGAIETDSEIMMVPIPESGQATGTAQPRGTGQPTQMPAPAAEQPATEAIEPAGKAPEAPKPETAAPAEASSRSRAAGNASEKTAMRYRYRGAGESSPSDATGASDVDSTAVLSDFDVTLDGEGLIE